MYLNFLLNELDVNKKDLADFLGVSYNTLTLKLRGKFDFTLSEALKIKHFLHLDLPIEKIFT